MMFPIVVYRLFLAIAIKTVDGRSCNSNIFPSSLFINLLMSLFIGQADIPCLSQLGPFIHVSFLLYHIIPNLLLVKFLKLAFPNPTTMKIRRF